MSKGFLGNGNGKSKPTRYLEAHIVEIIKYNDFPCEGMIWTSQIFPQMLPQKLMHGVEYQRLQAGLHPNPIGEQVKGALKIHQRGSSF